MLKKVLVYGGAVLLMLIVVLVVVVALQPSDFRMARSAKIAASPATVFAEVNDFHNWAHWSPWETIDPDMERVYEGSSAGTGSIYSWSGNDDVGAGRMEILKSVPNELVQIELQFIRPMATTNQTEFTFRPVGNETEVSWVMTGQNGFIGKAFCLIMDMDAMLGPQFEEGLAKMKATAEAAESAQPNSPMNQH